MVLSPCAPSYDGTNFFLVMFPAIISSVYGFLPFPLWSGFEGSPLIYGNQPTGPRLYRSRSRSIFDYVELELTGCQPSPSLLYSQRCYHFDLRVLLTLKNSQPVYFSFWLPRFSVLCPDKSSVLSCSESRFSIL